MFGTGLPCPLQSRKLLFFFREGGKKGILRDFNIKGLEATNCKLSEKFGLILRFGNFESHCFPCIQKISNRYLIS